jgi:hypothetical protein
MVPGVIAIDDETAMSAAEASRVAHARICGELITKCLCSIAKAWRQITSGLGER